MSKIFLFVFGTRPEAIKMAPVVRYFGANENRFKTLIAVTGQHREMLDQVLSLFELVPDYDLDIMAKNQTLHDITGKILNGISNLLIEIKPDILFVQGDTTTAFAASLGAFYHKVPVGHIEAGLRTNNIYSPFPEEFNRRIISSIATYHFVPTLKSKKNLIDENLKENLITITGNTVIDSLMLISKKIDLELDLYGDYFYQKFDINFDKKKTILVTGHRRESFGKGFENICQAIKEISNDNNTQFIYPVHLNPNVQEPVKRILGGIKNVFLIPPQEYIYFVYLMKKADIILTDSGGVQEEAPSLGKPVLVMRDTTERPEGIDAGTAKLVGTDKNNIINELKSLMYKTKAYEKMAKSVNPYGDGKASQRIYEVINKNFS